MEFCWDARTSISQDEHLTTLERRVTNPQIRPADSQEELNNTIFYLKHFGIILCKQHHTAIQNLDRHLQRFHKTTLQIRKKILQRHQQHKIVSPQDIQLPAPLEAPIQELGAPLDGFECYEEDCGFLTVNINKLRMHCKEQHKLEWKGNTSLLYRKVKVQTFFRTGGLQRYFIVQVAKGDEESGSLHEVGEIVEQRLAKWQVKLDEHKMEGQIMDAEAAKTDKTGWFIRTGWLQHLAKRDLVYLAHQSRLPDANEAKLKQVAELTQILIERSVKGLSTLARETRRWLKSVKPHEIEQRLIGRLQNPESQARYAGYIVKFVCYFLRIIADEEQRVRQMRSREDGRSDTESEVSVSSFGASGDESQIDSAEENEHPGCWSRRREADTMKDARELFRWTSQQKQLAIRLWLSLDNSDKGVQVEALLDVLASFIFTSTGNDPFNSGLIHFLAVLGIDAEAKRLRTAKTFSYMLAGIVYCVRVLAVEKLLPLAQRVEQTDEDREQFLLMRSKFLVDGSYSAMSELVSLLAYGKHIALNQGNSGNAYWSKDKKIFYLHGRPISINRFCKMAQDLVAEAEQMLWQELLWITAARDRFAIDLERVVDDITFTQREFSFLSRASNGLDDGLRWMLTRVEKSYRQKLQSSNGKWSVRHVNQYLRQVDRFLELLLLCVHITSGQPGRGSEVTTMRFRNGLLQDRNIFIMDGQVMTVIRYHKSMSQWDKPRVVPRFLPPRLSQVLVVYLAYLQPFQQYLRSEVLGGNFSDYLWADEYGPWETGRLTRALKRETGKRLGVELHTLDYRHTAIGIGRVVVGEGFGKGYQDEVGEIDEAELDEEGESVIELQNARTTKIGVGSYSVPIDIVKHLSIRSMEAFRPLSELWHRFLGLEEGEMEKYDESHGRKRQRTDCADIAATSNKVSRIEDNPDKAIKKAMQQVLGHADVSFRSVEQEQAMHAVLSGQTPLVVVLPTGGGKSLLFTVPACLEGGGVTVIVVPYRALVTDLVERIRKRGIHCIEWKYGENDPATIVVVSADRAGDVSSNGNFLSYATALSNKGLLRRVVVDECHLVFTSNDWRPRLAAVKNVRLLPCPIVLLTATLPPVREAELAASMLVQYATYIRAATIRPNTRYLVSWCEAGKKEETAVAMCQRQQQVLGDRQVRGVVYCHSKRQCEDVARVVGCDYYHAGVVDRAGKVERWLEKGGLIIATSALGTGVDYPGIVVTIHIGMPWAMIDFAQESGRGGRAGERVDSIIIVEKGEVESRLERNREDIDVQAMGMFLRGSGCRRGLMSGYLDGKAISCKDIEAAKCDRCGEGRQEWMDEQEQASREWEMVQWKLDELRDACALCWVFRGVVGEGIEEWKRHRTMQCNRDADINIREVDSFRREIRDGGGGHSCRRCWVSQKYCATGKDVAQRCQWPNVVIPVAFAAMGIEEGQKIIQRCGFVGQERKAYARWLGLRHRKRIWGELFSNAMVVGIRVILALE